MMMLNLGTKTLKMSMSKKTNKIRISRMKMTRMNMETSRMMMAQSMLRKKKKLNLEKT